MMLLDHPDYRRQMADTARQHGRPDAAAAVATALIAEALVGSLEHKGWKVVGRGEEWFAVRLAAARTVDRAGIDTPPVTRDQEGERKWHLDQTTLA